MALKFTPIDPAAAGAAAATPEAEARAMAYRDSVIAGEPDVAGFRKTGVLADMLGGRLDPKATPLYLNTSTGMRRVRYVRNFSDGPWLVTGGASAFDQQSFAVTDLTVLFEKAVAS